MVTGPDLPPPGAPPAGASPDRTALLRSPAGLLATWFGAGLLPVAPGTWGSAAALPAAWAIAWWGGWGALLAAAGLVFLIGWWASAVVERRLGTHDSGLIVVDEVAGQWLTLVPCPLDPVLYAAGFLLFRAADIAKPWPASWADRHVGGGLGVMLDDILAAIYAAGVLAMLAWGLAPVVGNPA